MSLLRTSCNGGNGCRWRTSFPRSCQAPPARLRRKSRPSGTKRRPSNNRMKSGWNRYKMQEINSPTLMSFKKMRSIPLPSHNHRQVWNLIYLWLHWRRVRLRLNRVLPASQSLWKKPSNNHNRNRSLSIKTVVLVWTRPNHLPAVFLSSL